MLDMIGLNSVTNADLMCRKGANEMTFSDEDLKRLKENISKVVYMCETSVSVPRMNDLLARMEAAEEIAEDVGDCDCRMAWSGKWVWCAMHRKWRKAKGETV